MMWRGPTPKPDALRANEEKWREKFSDNETLLFEGGPIPFSIVSQHFATWRNEAIISLAGEAAERLAFGQRRSDDARGQCLNLKLYWPRPTEAIP